MKSVRHLVLLTLAVVIGSTRAVAEDPSSPLATNALVIANDLVNRLLAEARTNNPSLLAADSRVQAAELNAEAVRTWEDPMAMFGGSVYDGRGFNPSEDGNLAYGVEQKLPLWGRPKLARKVAEAETGMRRAEVGFRSQQLRRDLTQALLTGALAEHVVELGEQDLAWLEVTAKTVESKYRTGAAVVADTLQIQNEVAQRADRLRSDRLRLAHSRLALNRLLNRPATSPWPSLRLPSVAVSMPYSEKLISLALANEPKLKVKEQEIKQAGAMAEAARKSRLPDVSLGVEGRQFSGDGGFRSGMFTLRVSLPWANGEKYRRDYAREQAKKKSAEQEREDQMLMVREELHHLTVGLDSARREALLQRDEIVPRATQALTSRLADWATGRGALRDVFDARRMALDAQLMSARAVAEQHGMLAELLLWTGLDNPDALAPLAHEPPIFSHDDTSALHDH